MAKIANHVACIIRYQYWYCNRRKTAEMITNVITVHNYGRDANNDSGAESLCEHAIYNMIKETSMDIASDVTDEIILQGIVK